MKLDEMDITTLWAELGIEELVRSGVTTFVISPGSRSTPLALAVARNKRATVITHFDERGAGFVAVGYARGAHKPAALICTSGTAVANYLPAVVEASMDHLPLIVLSADRPPELQDTGANQTIKQSGIFGSFVRWEQTIPCPTESIAPEFVLTTIDQAVYRATGRNAGPVHLNYQFREPLIPDRRQAVPRSYLSGVEQWKTNGKAFTTYSHSTTLVLEAEIGEIARLISDAKSGLLVVGRLKQLVGEIRGIMALSERLKWPVVTDVGSGLRLGQGVVTHLPYLDLTLLNEATTLRFDCILHLGGPLVSKRISEFVASQKSQYIVVNSHSERQDSGHCVTMRVVAEIGEFASALRAQLGATSAPLNTVIGSQSHAISELIDRSIDGGAFSELSVSRIVAKEINSDHALFLASSLTVRDFDMYAPCDGPRVPVGCNRGASGIDGTVASAVGFANGLNKPTTIVIGDTALLHDLNSLALLRDETAPPVTIVVVNNGGGAIFSMLPVADLWPDIAGEKTFEQLFLQGHSFDFKWAAEMFGLAYASPRDATEFRNTYAKSIISGKSSVIELRFDWRESRRVRWELRDNIKKHVPRMLSMGRAILGHSRHGKAGAPTLVFLHGFLGSQEDWLEIIEPLKSTHDIILIDLPGHGASVDCHEWLYRFDTCSQAIHNTCLSLGVSKFTIVGYSLGGRIGLYHTLTSRDQIPAIVLIGANPGMESTVAREYRRMHDGADACNLHNTPLEVFIDEWYKQSLFGNLRNSPGYEKIRTRRLSGSPSALARALRGFSVGHMPSMLDPLCRAGIPILFVAGALDSKYVDIGGKVADLCPQGKLHIIPRAGHAVHIEQPEELSRVIAAFVQPHV